MKISSWTKLKAPIPFWKEISAWIIYNIQIGNRNIFKMRLPVNFEHVIGKFDQSKFLKSSLGVSYIGSQNTLPKEKAPFSHQYFNKEMQVFAKETENVCLKNSKYLHKKSNFLNNSSLIFEQKNSSSVASNISVCTKNSKFLNDSKQMLYQKNMRLNTTKSICGNNRK